MKRYLPFIIVALVAVAALGVATAFYRAHRPAAAKTADVPISADGSESMHALGPANAPVLIEEFGDYQCPPCGKISEPLEQTVKDFRPKVRFIFRNLPLPLHAHSREAAAAAEAAGLQGRFWQMHSLLYREQAKWSNATDIRPLWDRYAGIVGLDVVRFRKDLEAAEVKKRIDADVERAATVAAKVTPTVFVNGNQVTGPALSPTGIHDAIAMAIKEREPAPPQKP